MIEIVMEEATAAMEKTLQALEQNLAKIRSGRAHPSIVQHVMVDYYGNATQMTQVANVAIEDARTLTITPWEQSMIPVIEKAIMTSDLGITPATSGNVIRLPMPQLTEERRKDMIKLAKSDAEKCRVSIRNARKEANSELKELNKQKELSDDELKSAEDKIQTLTDAYGTKVDNILSEKEKTLMEI